MSAVVRDVKGAVRSLRRVFSNSPKRLILKNGPVVYTTWVWEIKGIFVECLVGDKEKTTKLEKTPLEILLNSLDTLTLERLNEERHHALL